MNQSNRIPHQTAAIPVADGEVPAVVRRADGAAGAALVIAPSVFGVTDDLVGQMDALSGSASLVVAMDLFWRGQPGPLPYHDMATVMARLASLDRERALADFAAVVAWARAQPGCDGRVVGLGICFGGPFCILGAANGVLQGVVTWHGSRLQAYLGRAGEMNCPMALHFGECDRVVGMEVVDQVRAAFAGRPDVQVTVHPGADHGFSHPGAPTWDPAAAAAGMDSVRRLLGSASARSG